MLAFRPLFDARVELAEYYFRTGLRFETGAAELGWLNRVIAIARGMRRPRAVELTAFELLSGACR
jgi:hypothetical protein